MLRVTYQRMHRDLPNGSTHFDEPETLDLVEFERREPGEYNGVRLEGVDSEGRNVVVFAGGRMTVREADATGSYSYLGHARTVKGVTA
jgi:hypothetical protein